MSIKLRVRDTASRTLALTADRHTLIFRHVPSQEPASVQSSPRVTPRCIVDFSDQVDLSEFRLLRTSDFYGTLGLINIGADVFLCLITNAVRVASVRPGESVHRILSVDFFCLNTDVYDSNQSPSFDSDEPYYNELLHSASAEDPALEHPCQDLRRMLSGGTFYYSVDFDLTNRLQDRYSAESAFDTDRLDDSFLWNQYMIEPLLRFRERLAHHDRESLDASRMLTSAIRGFVATITMPPSVTRRENGAHLPSSLTLISRLSCRRAGTRFNSRGIDDDGNVANFVESETVFWLPSEQCFSYAQVRGSVPLFWEQAPGILPGQQKIQITRSTEATQPAFDRHFAGLEADYGSVSILNLLSESKPGEVDLVSRYKYHVQKSPLRQALKIGAASKRKLHELQFDFHAESRGGRMEAAGAVKRLVQHTAESFGYFLCGPSEQGRSQGKASRRITLVILQQKGVFRTNCLDCLDRTNLVQTILSQLALENFFQQREEVLNSGFWARHSSLWADSGDALSKIYAGTGAIKSSFTRHGKMSLAGALADARKSATRLYVNNFVDKGRQNTIDMLLGRLMDQAPVHLYDPVTDFVNSELGRRQDEYTESETIHMWVGTFNLNGKSIGASQSLKPWLRPKTASSLPKPEFVVAGFQEMVELSPQQIMSTDPARRLGWEEAVKKTLNQDMEEEYVLLRSGQLVGAALTIFVKASKLHKIKDVEGGEKKTGMSGMAGNKGAVAIRMDYSSTRLCFVTAHLAAGFANTEERNRDYRTISRGLLFQRNRSIQDHDAIIWAGDFNYRIGLGDELVRQLVASNDLETLYQNDQLNLQMVAGHAFSFYSEWRIQFPPTYKYEIGADMYTSSEKARIPAWCDRILCKGDGLKQLEYATAPLNFSDHRPVFALFSCKIRTVNEAAKEVLTQRLYARRRAEVGEAYFQADEGESDGELIGYDAITSSLPPASSDQRKWWLDGGQPARVDIKVPNEGDRPNSRRPNNPFTVTSQPDWMDNARPALPERRISERHDQKHIRHETKSTRSPHRPRGHYKASFSPQASNDSTTSDLQNGKHHASASHYETSSNVSRKPVPPTPKKPEALSSILAPHSILDDRPETESTRVSSEAAHGSDVGSGRRSVRALEHSTPVERFSNSHNTESRGIPNLLDDDPDMVHGPATSVLKPQK